MNAAVVVAALVAGHPEPDWVTIPEAPNGKWSPRRCDLLAMHSWTSHQFEVHGYEVKVTRADWAKELATPAKAESWWQWCDRWSLAIPAEMEAKILSAGDVPVGWGLVVIREDGRRSWRRRPDLHEREQWPWGLVAVMLSTVDRRRRADLQAAITAAVGPLQRQVWDLEARIRSAPGNRAQAQLDSLRLDIQNFEERTGLVISDGFAGIDPRVPRLVQLVQAHMPGWEHSQLGQTAKSLRVFADRIEALCEGLGLPVPATRERRPAGPVGGV